MGLRAWFVKKKVEKILKNSNKLSELTDELLKQSQDKYTRTLRDAEKINKANLMRVKERQLRQELRESLDDNDDDDYSDDEDESDDDNEQLNPLEKGVEQLLVSKFLPSLALNPKVEELISQISPETRKQFLDMMTKKN